MGGPVGEEIGFRVRSVETHRPDDIMLLNQDTLASLQILRSELHPNAQMHGQDSSHSGAKESLSVYGLFCFLAVTPQGKSRLRRLFLQPVTDLGLIEERHLTIELLVRPDNSETLENLHRILKKIKNVRTPVSQLRRGVHLPPGGTSMNKGVWPILGRFVRYARELRETMLQVSHNPRSTIITKVRSGVCARAP